MQGDDASTPAKPRNKRKAADAVAEEDNSPKAVEISPVHGREMRIPKTRKRKSAVKEEDEEVAEPLAKKLKEEVNELS